MLSPLFPLTNPRFMPLPDPRYMLLAFLASRSVLVNFLSHLAWATAVRPRSAFGALDIRQVRRADFAVMAFLLGFHK